MHNVLYVPYDCNGTKSINLTCKKTNFSEQEPKLISVESESVMNQLYFLLLK